MYYLNLLLPKFSPPPQPPSSISPVSFDASLKNLCAPTSTTSVAFASFPAKSVSFPIITWCVCRLHADLMRRSITRESFADSVREALLLFHVTIHKRGNNESIELAVRKEIKRL